MNAAIEGINNSFDRIAQVSVAQAISDCSAVRVGDGTCESLNDPVLVLILLVAGNSFLDRDGDQIRIATELQKRCDRSDPLLDITPQQQARVGCHRTGC